MLLVGIGWIIVMAYICYRGIEVSAWFQHILLTVELVMLLVLSVTALVRVGNGHHPPGLGHAELQLAAPVPISQLQAFISGIILMLFIYWGWDTAVSVNEETKDKNKTPGRAAIISTVMLLITYHPCCPGWAGGAGEQRRRRRRRRRRRAGIALRLVARWSPSWRARRRNFQ